MTKQMVNLAIKVKERRKTYGYTTADLAHLLDVSAGLINNIENTKNDVFKLQLLNNMINLLNIAPDEILEINKSNLNLLIKDSILTINLDIRNITDNNKHELISTIAPVLELYVEIAASYQGNKKILKQVNNCVLQQLSLFKLINCS